MLEWVKYPHISHLLSLKFSPRMLLGKRLLWTHKRDGSCMSFWWKEKSKGSIKRIAKVEKIDYFADIDGKKYQLMVSSKNMATASNDLKELVKSTEEYEKIYNLLLEEPKYVIFAEACRKGRSITGAEIYDKNFLIVFDIFNKGDNRFLPYVPMYQRCYHWKIPVVKLHAETRHTSVKDLLKYKHFVLEECKRLNLEGMVIKTNPHRVIHPHYNPEFLPPVKAYVQAKVKLDIPIATVKKIARGEPIFPEIPENEIMGAIDKVWQVIGTEKFKDKKIAMPLIAKYVSTECKLHYYTLPARKLFLFYQAYIERHLSRREY